MVEDPLYLDEHRGRVLTFERHLKLLERITGLPDGRPLLDMGCYTGIFVEIAAMHGWGAWGLEPSHWAVEQARARGLRVAQGTLDTADLPEGRFDVMTLWDVIEHLTDPCRALKQVHHLLRSSEPVEGKPGGLMVVHTIDIENPFARLMDARWPCLMEMHVYYFSRRTVARFCRVWLRGDQRQAPRALPAAGLLDEQCERAAAARRASSLVADKKLGLRRVAVPIDLGDLLTVYARKVGTVFTPHVSFLTIPPCTSYSTACSRNSALNMSRSVAVRSVRSTLSACDNR